MICPNCSRSFYGAVPPLRCSCGTVSRTAPAAEPPSALWDTLHNRRGFDRHWFEIWQERAMRSLSECDCRKHWQDILRRFPVPFDGTPDDQFQWAWRVHDAVSQRINNDGSGRVRKRITLAQAYGRYRQEGA